jgi:hypothetical protein
MSNSTLKLYKSGYARGEYLRKKRESEKVTKYSFYIGNYFDFLITEPKKAIEVIYDGCKDAFTSNKISIKFLAEMNKPENKGKFVMNQSTYDICEAMKKSLKAYQFDTKSLFENGNFQEEIWFDMESESSQILSYKAKLDYLEIDSDGMHIIRDLKTTASLESRKNLYWRTIKDLDYSWQAYTYRMAVSQKYNIPYEQTRFEWVFVEKSEFAEVLNWIPSEEMLLTAKMEIEKTIDIFLDKNMYNEIIEGMEF